MPDKLPKLKEASPSDNTEDFKPDETSASYDTEKALPPEVYEWLFRSYVFFNVYLFDGKLPGCMITLQRKRGAAGFFHAGRFVGTTDENIVVDELAINPAYLEQNPVEALATLVHEMVHCSMHASGKGSQGRYHNKKWAVEMRSIGLIPSDTGKPGGKETGERISHYVRPGGRFEVACDEFLAANPATLLRDRSMPKDEGDKQNKRRRKQSASKTKFTCPGCGENVWGRPGTRVKCDACDELMCPQEEEDPFKGAASE